MPTQDGEPCAGCAEKDAQIVRLWDLVRYQRRDLFSARLISQAEYAALMTERPGAVARLGTYDEMRNEIAALQARMEQQRMMIGILEQGAVASKSLLDETEARALAAEKALAEARARR